MPITDRVNEYAERIAAELRRARLRVETNLRGEKIGAKIRDAQLQKVPYMLILGDKEVENRNISLRHRTKGDLGAYSLEGFVEELRHLITTRATDTN